MKDRNVEKIVRAIENLTASVEMLDTTIERHFKDQDERNEQAINLFNTAQALEKLADKN